MRFIQDAYRPLLSLLLLACLAIHSGTFQENPFGDSTLAASSEESGEVNPFGPVPLPVSAKPTHATKATPKPQPFLSTDGEIRAAMLEQYDIIYDEAEFIEVLGDLRSDRRFNIHLDPNLEGELDGESLVTANLSQLPLGDCLRIMLNEHNATWVIHRGALKIISLDDLNTLENLVTKAFPVADLVGPSITKPVGDAAQGDSRRELADSIRRSTNPDSWIENGGDCSISFVGNAMVVHSNEECIERIESLLAQIRKANPKPTK